LLQKYDTRKYLCNHFIIFFIVLYKHCFRHYNVYIILVPPLHQPSPRRERRGHAIHCTPRVASRRRRRYRRRARRRPSPRRGHVIHCSPRAAIQSLPPLPAPPPAPAPLVAVSRVAL